MRLKFIKNLLLILVIVVVGALGVILARWALLASPEPIDTPVAERAPLENPPRLDPVHVEQNIYLPLTAKVGGGYTIHNLTALLALDTLWCTAMQPIE